MPRWACRNKRVSPNLPFAGALWDVLGSLGLTQIELAQRAGVSESTMSRWVLGRFRPSRAAQQRLLDVVATAPARHVHALAHSMLADPTVAYPEGVDAPALARIVPYRADQVRSMLDVAVRDWGAELGVKPERRREALAGMLGTVKDAGIDRSAQAFLGGA
jgi:transcriptional regulator with XRE-family HTH domain